MSDRNFDFMDDDFVERGTKDEPLIEFEQRIDTRELSPLPDFTTIGPVAAIVAGFGDITVSRYTPFANMIVLP